MAVNFGEPIHLNALLDQQQPQWREQQYDADTKPPWLPALVGQLAFTVAANINRATALNPINLVATTMLATARQAIDGVLLNRHLTLLVDMQQQYPYSERVTFPAGDAAHWIEYAESMESLSHVAQPLGDVYGLSSKNTVMMSYYRNNIQHLYMVPALVIVLVAQRRGIALGELKLILARVYPYIQNELFLADDAAQATAAADNWLAYFAAKGFLYQENEFWYAIDRSHSSWLQCELLMNIVMPSLERYFIGLSALVRIGSNRCTAEELEQQSQLIAQRLSLLNGLDAPEFFDKTLFRRFIAGLQKQEEIVINSEGLIEFTTALTKEIEQADKILPAQLIYSIRQAEDVADNESADDI